MHYAFQCGEQMESIKIKLRLTASLRDWNRENK